MTEYYAYMNDLGRAKALIVETSENETSMAIFDRATGDFCGGTMINERSLQEFLNHYKAVRIFDIDKYMGGGLR